PYSPLDRPLDDHLDESGKHSFALPPCQLQMTHYGKLDDLRRSSRNFLGWQRLLTSKRLKGKTGSRRIEKCPQRQPSEALPEALPSRRRASNRLENISPGGGWRDPDGPVDREGLAQFDSLHGELVANRERQLIVPCWQAG